MNENFKSSFPQAKEHSRHEKAAQEIGNMLMDFSPKEQFEIIKGITDRAKNNMHSRVDNLSKEVEGIIQEIESIKQMIGYL